MTAIGLAATIGGAALANDATMSIVTALALGSIAVVLVVTLTHAAITAHEAASKPLPRVRLVKVPPTSYKGIGAVLLLDSSELFATDTVVAIYHIEDEQYEALVGAGRVLTIQDTGLIQVGVTHFAPEYKDLMQRLLQNEVRALKSLLVKPHIPTSLQLPLVGDQRERES